MPDLIRHPEIPGAGKWKRGVWIPAFAGMTNEGRELYVLDNSLTDSKSLPHIKYGAGI